MHAFQGPCAGLQINSHVHGPQGHYVVGPSPCGPLEIGLLHEFFEDATPDGAVAITVRSSLQLSVADVAALEGLVASRNRFVCLQLLTMVREQHSKNLAAAASGDKAWLQQAELVFLATITVGGQLVGAALFYPRLPKVAAKPSQGNATGPGIARTISLAVRAGVVGSEHGAPAASWPLRQDVAGAWDAAAAATAAAADQASMAPQLLQSVRCGRAGSSMVALQSHVYVELICVNTPGKGYGSLLLSHVERFVKANAALLEERHPQFGALAGVKLLSVSSAQHFYSKQGYREPDEFNDMFKPLHTLP